MKYAFWIGATWLTMVIMNSASGKSAEFCNDTITTGCYSTIDAFLLLGFFISFPICWHKVIWPKIQDWFDAHK